MLPLTCRFYGQIGEQRRFDCPSCGDARGRLYVKRVAGGWKFHCHNCAPKMSGFCRDSTLLTPSQLAQVLHKPERNQVVSQSEIRLPSDFSPDIPDRGKAWLYGYGISELDVAQYGFGYSVYCGRLILPVYDAGGSLVFWQGRNLGQVTKENPKYINVRAAGRLVFFEAHPSSLWLRRDCCVLVEDILSAIRVGRYFPCIALLGSYIPTELFRNLNGYKHLHIWLDKDKTASAARYMRRMAVLMNKSVGMTVTDLDPKEQTDEFIRSIL